MNNVVVDDIWAEDLLGRSKEAKFIEDFIISRIKEREKDSKSKSYVLNIDGSWGQGKSFFLERLQKQLSKNNYLSAYINAWKDDHADDPMIAVMAAIDDALKVHLSKQKVLPKLWEKTKKNAMQLIIATMRSGGKKLVNKFTEDGFREISIIISNNEAVPQTIKNIDTKELSTKIDNALERFIDVRADKALKNFQDTKITIETFRNSLSAFTKEISNGTSFQAPLFILIDELDRCRPPYAIATLERIKHFFDVDGVVFLIATDSTQLKHSIKAIYGQDFDSNRYLLRFFDRTYKFSDPTHNSFVKFLFSSKPLDMKKFDTPFLNLETVFLKMVSGGILDLSLRDIGQCYDYLRTVSSIWKEEVPIHSMYMIQLIINYQQGLYKDFKSASVFRFTDDLKAQTQHIGTMVESRDEDPYGRTKAHPDISFNEVISRIYNLANKSFAEIIRLESSTLWENTIQTFFTNEFARIHNNKSDNKSKKISIIHRYYLYVQSAGRLSSDE